MNSLHRLRQAIILELKWHKILLDLPRIVIVEAPQLILTLEMLRHEKCLDRGDSLRRSSQKALTPSVGHQYSESPTKSASLYYALYNARVSYLTNTNTRFIPFDKLELARDRKLVEQALEEDEVPQTDIPILLDKICSAHPAGGKRSFFRIFAVLVLCQKAGCISKFIEYGVDDSYLPLPTIERSPGTINILPHKNGPNIERGKLENLFRDRNIWSQPILNAFNTYQWLAIAPFFDRQGRIIPHYLLEADDVMPITEKRNQLEYEYEANSMDPDVKEVVLGGGFGDVFIVKLHPSHYSFKDQPHRDNSHLFALKCLKSPSKSEFQLEVDALIKHNHSIDQHLIPLLATIQKEEDNVDKYYLLFPKANGDLRHFWKTEFSRNPDGSLLRWMAEQCLGITKALSLLHQDQDEHKEDDHPIYGRHGDIKAANILWFSKPDTPGPAGWRLVISDFGLARFHRAISISAQTASKMKKTLTYQAPEFDIIGAKVSRKSDVWALGCTFLEFTTCYIMGYEAVEEDFPSRRGETDKTIPSLNEDRFYRTTDDKRSAELKPGVRKWIAELRQDPKCTPYLHGLLNFIENRMFRIKLDGRPTAAQVAEELEYLLKIA